MVDDDPEARTMLAKILTEQLAQRAPFGHIVQRVVRHLKRHPEGLPELKERLPALGIGIGQHRAHAAGRSDQGRRLMLHDLQIVALGQ